MITKRSISNQTPNGVWRNRDKATENKKVFRLLASTIQFSNHHARHRTHPPEHEKPENHDDGRDHATPHKDAVAVREPKSVPAPLPRPETPAGKPTISSTPATPTTSTTIMDEGGTLRAPDVP